MKLWARRGERNVRMEGGGLEQQIGIRTNQMVW